SLIESSSMKQALALVDYCSSKLAELGCSRAYATLNFDIRIGHEHRLKPKKGSAEKYIGEASK
ncbi:thiamine-binding protein, partial [Aliarcobacter butzleri]